MEAKTFAILVGVLVLSLAADLGTKEWALNKLSASEAELGFAPRGAAEAPVCEEDDHGLVHMQRIRKSPIVIIPSFLELRYAENCGAAFGLMHKAPRIARILLFGVTALGVSIGLLVMLYRGQRGALFNWSVPLIVSGAIGNFADRIRHGYVVDFIRAYARSWEWPTFNVADATITVGIVLMLLEGFRAKDPDATPTPAEPSASNDPSLD